MRKNLGPVFRTSIGNVFFIIAPEFVMPYDLSSCGFVDHFFVNIDHGSILVPLDASVDVLGRQWVSFGLRCLVFVSKNVANSLSLSLEFLLCVDPASLATIEDLGSGLAHGLGVSGSETPLGLGSLDVIGVQRHVLRL